MTTTTMTTMTTMKTSVKMPMTSDQCGAAHLHVARIAALMMLAGIAIGSPSSRAQVAVAVTFPDQNPTHRDLAAGIVEQLGKHWDFLAPPLAADDLALCRADVACLRPLASRHGASHLLLIGIAGLDAREAAVTARVIGPTGQSLFEETVVVVGSAAPRADGAPLADRMIRAVRGVPPTRQRRQRVAPAVPMSTSTALGSALVAVGAVVAASSVGVATLAAGDAGRHDLALAAAASGGILGALTAVVGAAVVVFDAAPTDP
jgi:hypothetical protein